MAPARSQRPDRAGAREQPLASQPRSCPCRSHRGCNDLFGNIHWTDDDRVSKLITQEIPEKVNADPAYQAAKEHSDKQNARVEHDEALERVIVSLISDDSELFKQFMDNPDFKKWLADTVFGLTYESPAA